jgi:hypothetical protein
MVGDRKPLVEPNCSGQRPGLGELNDHLLRGIRLTRVEVCCGSQGSASDSRQNRFSIDPGAWPRAGFRTVSLGELE